MIPIHCPKCEKELNFKNKLIYDEDSGGHYLAFCHRHYVIGAVIGGELVLDEVDGFKWN